jgi:hypothetical protein
MVNPGATSISTLSFSTRVIMREDLDSVRRD